VHKINIPCRRRSHAVVFDHRPVVCRDTSCIYSKRYFRPCLPRFYPQYICVTATLHGVLQEFLVGQNGAECCGRPHGRLNSYGGFDRIL
jgi:hypothetical protein